ncbi:hypothetical protein DSCO28_21350 [Desulfosarcina ovata subsp. sediminis]|uniref:DUF202 domain-containing protein n=1 Tax=Desulfosarcina ovata subsp. sediminis TaxID=885957 RepID=A0A5K7ZP75_9BACT|nr:hypothetical protein [Desulfosarcina ovata]BBO81569.1 hypothetical protein DSCO28_21350 [Desulfosarcina ovata subsp. sediminis]
MSDKKEAFIRWQGRSLDYLSYAINLILTFSVAGIGFEAKLLSEDTFSPIGFAKPVFMSSIAFFILAGAVGFACIINRIKDFKDTAAIARKKTKDEYDAELLELRELVGILGKNTRRYFNWQSSLFCTAVILLIISFSLMYQHKLF